MATFPGKSQQHEVPGLAIGHSRRLEIVRLPGVTRSDGNRVGSW